MIGLLLSCLIGLHASNIGTGDLGAIRFGGQIVQSEFASVTTSDLGYGVVSIDVGYDGGRETFLVIGDLANVSVIVLDGAWLLAPSSVVALRLPPAIDRRMARQWRHPHGYRVI